MPSRTAWRRLRTALRIRSSTTMRSKAFALISHNLVRAIENGKDIEARTAVSLGSLYGGMCLGPVNTAAVHALSYPLGGEFHVAHGVANAVLLPHVLEFNLPAAPKRYAEVAIALGVTPGATYEETAKRGLDRGARAIAPVRASRDARSLRHRCVGDRSHVRRGDDGAAAARTQSARGHRAGREEHLSGGALTRRLQKGLS